MRVLFGPSLPGGMRRRLGRSREMTGVVESHRCSTWSYLARRNWSG
jgi:hypothetical protein